MVLHEHSPSVVNVRRPSRSIDMIHFRSQHSAAIGLVTLTFDILTLKLVRIIVCSMGNPIILRLRLFVLDTWETPVRQTT